MAAVLPIAYLVVRVAAADGAAVTDTLFRSRTGELLGRSALLTVTVTLCATVLGASAAWLSVGCRIPLARLWQVLAVLPLAVPTYVAGLAYISTWPGLAGFGGATLVLTLYAAPYAYLPVAAAVRGLDPAQREVARAQGSTSGDAFLRVTLPQLRPALATGGLLVALYTLSDFGAVSLMRYDVLTMGIYSSYRASFDRTPAAVLGCVLVFLTVALVVGEARTRGRARYSRIARGVARAPDAVDLGRWRWPAVTALGVVAAVSLGTPAVVLTTWLTRSVRGGVGPETWRAAIASLTLAGLAALVTVFAALPVGILAARYRSRLGMLVERASYAGHALPGIVVALSLVFFGARYVPLVYQRTPLLVFAYFVLFLPLAVGTIAVSGAQTSASLEDVARSLGRRPFGVLRTVTAPLVAPGVVTGALLVLLTTIKELPATLLLRPTGVETLATRVWAETGAGAFAAAAPPAALLVLAAAVPTWLLTRRPGGLE